MPEGKCGPAALGMPFPLFLEKAVCRPMLHSIALLPSRATLLRLRAFNRNRSAWKPGVFTNGVHVEMNVKEKQIRKPLFHARPRAATARSMHRRLSR